jgi:hypothetical protein
LHRNLAQYAPHHAPDGLGAGIDKDRPDYTVYSGGWAVGRIYETRGGPDHLRWFWSLTVDPPDGALGQGGDLGGGQGAVLEELGRLEGVGQAAGNAVALEHETHEITKNGQVAGRSRGTELAISAIASPLSSRSKARCSGFAGSSGLRCSGAELTARNLSGWVWNSQPLARRLTKSCGLGRTASCGRAGANARTG